MTIVLRVLINFIWQFFPEDLFYDILGKVIKVIKVIKIVCCLEACQSGLNTR